MDIEQKAFARLREGELMSRQYYNKPLLICYSGGKDSDALVQLAINSGIKFEVLHNHTTAAAPETVYHIRDTFRRLEVRGIKCFVEYPMHKGKRTTMWDYLNDNNTPCNPLYSEGFDRVGCIGCPMANKKRYAEFQRYPKYKRAYIRAFDRMIEERKKSGLDVRDSWRNGEAVFRWWMGENPDQLKFEDLEKGT